MNRRMRWCRPAVMCLLSMIFACGCQPQSVTMELEALILGEEAQAMIQAMSEYQADFVEQYAYPVLGEWMNVNRTASVAGAEPGEIMVLTRNEEDCLEWRLVKYQYPFSESMLLSEGTESGEEPLLISPLRVSPDGRAVAYQALKAEGRFIEISEWGRPTVLLGGDGQVYTADSELSQVEEPTWSLMQSDWSSDGRFLLFYRSNNLVETWDEEEIDLEVQLDENGEVVYGNTEEGSGSVLILGDVYGYDRESCQVRRIWEAMKLNLPVDKIPAFTVVADAAEDKAVMFLLFKDENCPDLQLWNRDGVLEVRLMELPADPCLQIDMEQEIYYYRQSGDIWKSSMGKWGQSELVMAAGEEIGDFLISETGKRIFTIETQGETGNICVYLQDEKGSWYKQIVAVDMKGACALQLSDDQQRLLVECRTETENQALIVHFSGSQPANGSAEE